MVIFQVIRTYLLINRLEDAAHDGRLAFGRANLIPSDLVTPEMTVSMDVEANVNTYTIQNHDLFALFTVTLVQ
jgi:hypothetical protein